MLRRIAVLNRSFQLLHGNKSLAELQDLLTEYTCRIHDLLSFGWVQYEGPLESLDPHISSASAVWLGVSWDRENTERRGTRTEGRLDKKGPEQFKSITQDVSFVKLQSLPEWSLEGVSFIEAVIHRYSTWTSLSLDEMTKTKLQIVGLPSHIVSRASNSKKEALTMAKWNLQSINLAENLLLWRWTDIWQILSVSKSVDKLVLSKCSYLFHPFSRASHYAELEGSVNDDGAAEGFDLSELVISEIKNHFESPPPPSPNRRACAELIHKFLVNFRKLDTLDLSANDHIDDESVQIILRDAPSASGLKCLRLSHTKIHDCKALFTQLNITTPNCYEVVLSNVCLDWDGWQVANNYNSPQITALNVNFSNLRSWENFLTLCTVFPNLRSLRVRHNPFIEGDHHPEDVSSDLTGSNQWALQRYLRFSLLPHLEWADGEHIDAAVRKEAELYIISLVANVERSSLLPAEVRDRLYGKDNLLYPLLKGLSARHQQDWDETLSALQSELGKFELIEQRAIETVDSITKSLALDLEENTKSKVLDVIRNAPSSIIRLQIECKAEHFQCTVFPDLTSIWRIKQQVSRLMKDPEIIHMKAFWIFSNRLPHDSEYDEILISMPEVQRLDTKYSIKKKIPCSTLLTPPFGFLDYFGMSNSDSHAEPQTFKILLTN